MIDKVKEMPTAVTTAIAAIKGFAKYLIIPTGAIMFAPDDLLTRFRLLEIKNSFGQWVAILFWVSVSIVLVDLFSWIIRIIEKKIETKRLVKNLEKSFDTLNDEELEIIALIYRNDSYSFNFNDAPISYFTSLKIITSPSASKRFTAFSYTLQP
ncbi:hypothetical protein FACS1894219_10120 [Clostridia bacterium]|nr:hypothetical protein FACS1894219_10120 [Clostridia bacterium]